MDKLSEYQFLVVNSHTKCINSIAFSERGNFFATGGDDLSIFVWEPKSGRLFKKIETSLIIKAIAINREETLIAVGGPDRIIELFEIGSGKLVIKLCGHTSMITNLVFDDIKRVIISGCDAEEVKIWNWETGECLNSLYFEDCTIDRVDINRAANKLLIGLGGRRNEVLVYDISDLRFYRKSINNNNREWGYTFRDSQFSFLGDLIFCLNSNGKDINIWKTKNAYPFKTLNFGNHTFKTFSIFDKKNIIVGDIKGAVSIINYEKDTIFPVYFANVGEMNPVQIIVANSKISLIAILHSWQKEAVIINVDSFIKRRI